MGFTFQGFCVAILGILPGFFLLSIRTIVAPERNQVKLQEWIASSVLTSLVLNSLVMVPFIIFITRINLNANINAVTQALYAQKLWVLGLYIAVLYIIALVGGLAGSLLAEWQPRVLAHSWRLTPISPAPNVFSDTLAITFRSKKNRGLRGQPEQMVPWLRLERAKIVIVGRLQRSSVRFDVNQPVEVFLSPAFVFEPSAVRRVASPNGMYLRVLPEDIVEILSEQGSWTPPPGALLN